MEEALGAAKGERSAKRAGYRSGYYARRLITRVGKLELRVPQDRSGHFSTEVFERYERSEKALVCALAEMYVQGVSTRKVKAITEELCGHAFSASSISQFNQMIDRVEVGPPHESGLDMIADPLEYSLILSSHVAKNASIPGPPNLAAKRSISGTAAACSPTWESTLASTVAASDG